jgi:hypothetical protein
VGNGPTPVMPTLDWLSCTDHASCQMASAARVPGGESMDRDAALRILGLRDEVHPDDVYAYVITDPAIVALSRAVNREHYGHPSWTATVEGAGTLVVLDFRPVLAESGIDPTDPGKP